MVRSDSRWMSWGLDAARAEFFYILCWIWQNSLNFVGNAVIPCGSWQHGLSNFRMNEIIQNVKIRILLGGDVFQDFVYKTPLIKIVFFVNIDCWGLRKGFGHAMALLWYATPSLNIKAIFIVICNMNKGWFWCNRSLMPYLMRVHNDAPGEQSIAMIICVKVCRQIINLLSTSPTANFVGPVGSTLGQRGPNVPCYLG